MREERWRKLLREGRVARLATHSEQGRIHLVPVCYAYDGKHIFIGTDLDSKKVRNVKKNGNVAFVVDHYVEDWSKLKGVMIQGRAEVIESGKEFEEAKKLLYEKYPQYEATVPIKEGESAILKITPEKVVSWDYES
jgi:PPOX class probable F420-dependent enzyme